MFEALFTWWNLIFLVLIISLLVFYSWYRKKQM
jgi:hypothetical protein